MSTTREFAQKPLTRAVLAVYGVTHLMAAQGAPTSIHSEPLGTSGGTPEKPNLMFILDDSGSMAQDYTPDYVDDALCRDSFEDTRLNPSGTDRTLSDTSPDGRDDNSTLDSCRRGDPTWTSSDYNFQYYNPAITYTPGYDPTLPEPAASPAYLANSNMTNYNTPALWAAVENDPYPSNNPSGTTNLIYGNTDSVFCNTRNPTTAQLFNTSVCKLPIDTSITIAAETAGTGVWRYPNAPISLTNNTASPLTSTDFAFRFNRTGTSSNPVRPYFHTISQVLFCVNRNGNTSGTRPAHGNSPSKVYFGKGSTTNATDKCHVRRFNDGTTNYQYPRFGVIPYSSTADTQALNTQEVGTLNDPNRWAGLSGFRRHEIVETSTGSNTLPASYPSRADAAVYGNRADCSFAPCNYTQEMTNYANWWAYYRTRMLQMKTAAGQAFRSGLDDKFRVGFITINPGDPVSSSRYLPLRLFDAGHKSAWYQKFYSQNTNGGTPLREALSRVGRHFAGRTDRINDGMGFAADSINDLGNPDSMTKSCQRNIALLTTDGYWTNASSAYDNTANTGWKIDGTTRMDDQDNTQGGSTVARPFYDGPGVQNSNDNRSVGTLADVAYYYYINDLRPSQFVSGQDVWVNNVPASGSDTATHQHMTTYTLGLGLDGILEYQSNYTANPTPPGDYKDIVDGVKNWPAPPSAGNNEKALDDLWHAAVNGRGKFFSARLPSEVSAALLELISSISAQTGAGAAAATSNLQPVAGDNWAFTAEYRTQEWHGDLTARTIDLVSGVVSTRTLWSARDLLDSKAPNTRSIYLSTNDTANFPNKLKPFTWTGAGSTYLTDTNLTAAEQTHFNTALLAVSNAWNGAQIAAGTPKTLVEFLRGDTSRERDGLGTPEQELYRDRVHVLGDIVSAQPLYIKLPPFTYTDAGYSAYQTANSSRRGTVFAASNDGMLHAFETDPDNSPYYQIGGISTIATGDDTFSTGSNDGGAERWAFIPSRVMPYLYQLARTSYSHRWFVDGSPVVEDMCVTTGSAGSGNTTSPSFTCPGQAGWKTILVGGLNGGGRGYYALDVTDPMTPKALWEFNARDPSVTGCAATTAAAVGASNDCDLGLTFGNPIVAKLPLGHAHSGKWVVMFASGYNNIPGVDGTTTNTGGNGNGYLYILDANTGTIIEKIQTCTGSAGTAPTYADANPCGFTKINAFHPLANDKIDNSPVRIYGTTITGEIWRVDLTQQLSPRAHQVAILKDPGGTVQPITTPPEIYIPKGLDTLTYANPWDAPAAIYVGTGRFLGTFDPANTQQQTLYAIKDVPGSTSTLNNARTSLQARTFGAEFNVTDSLNNERPARDLTGGTSNAFTANAGWYADFPADTLNNPTGERVNVDSRIVSTTWVVASNVPNATTSSCAATSGDGWLNFIDVNTGASIPGLSSAYASVKLGGTLLVGVSPIQIGDKIKTIATTADNQQITLDTPIAASAFTGRRIQWRELTTSQ